MRARCGAGHRPKSCSYGSSEAHQPDTAPAAMLIKGAREWTVEASAVTKLARSLSWGILAMMPHGTLRARGVRLRVRFQFHRRDKIIQVPRQRCWTVESPPRAGRALQAQTYRT